MRLIKLHGRIRRRVGGCLNRISTLIVCACGAWRLGFGAVARSSEMSFASQSTRGSGQFIDSDLDVSALGSSLWRQKWRILRPAVLVGLDVLITVQVLTPR